MNLKTLYEEGYIYVGECGVDSGQIIVVDPCYVMHGERKGNQSELPSDMLTYREMVDRKNYDKPAEQLVFSGIGGTGVLTSSGYGDGVYPVFMKLSDEGDWGVRVSDVIIKFIFSSDDEDWLRKRKTEDFAELFCKERLDFIKKD